MKKLQLSSIGLLFLMAACTTSTDKKATETTTVSPGVKNEAVSYAADTVLMNGYIAFDTASGARRPVVLVVHEWWGQNDYTRNRANQLAELGYLAMAVDMYGNGQTAEDPENAGKLSLPFYTDPQMAQQRFHAALVQIKKHRMADTSKVAAIGYCFGGAQVLNMARLGEDLDGVVSFHGNLSGVPVDKNRLKANVLVCHGEADQFVPKEEVELFKKQMDSIGAAYTFKSYAGATHAFTNPGATEKGKQFNIPIAYNAAADSSSWNDMKDFLKKIF